MSRRRRSGLTFTAAAVALSAGGCVALPRYRRESAPIPVAWSGPRPSAARGLPSAQAWWSGFGDPHLCALIDAALHRSLGVRAAADRLRAARDMVIVARAGLWPEVALLGAPVDPGATADARGSNLDSGRFEMLVEARYELDLWRRVGSLVEATRWDSRARAFDVEALRLALGRSVAHAYFQIHRLDEAAAVETKRTVGAAERLRLAELEQAAGRTSVAPVLDARDALRVVRSRIEDLRRKRMLAAQQLAVLIGETPESLHVPVAPLRDTVEAQAPPEGLPSSLLERRPDLRAAEARLAALDARIGVARAALFPNVSLTASFGFASDVLRRLASAPSPLFGVGPEIGYAIFDAGKTRAEIDASVARRDEALASYREAILEALHDVERSLVEYQGTVAAYEDAVATSRERREAIHRVEASIARGRSTRFDLLAAEDRALEADLSVLDTYAARLDALLALYHALGGGWQGARPSS